MEWIQYSLVYTADSIQKFDSKSNRTADSIRDSIWTQKNDSQVPSHERIHSQQLNQRQADIS